jgi:signal transduction histidine kinase
MMDRTTALVEGIRQISSDIAHDLRRPLAHHNQDIVRVLSAPRSAEEYRAAMIRASGQVGEVLATFQALLQITELEAGAPGLELEAVDLTEVAARIVEAYGPMAEEGGRSVTLSTPRDLSVFVLGEARLIGRLLANLVENALIHTRTGTEVVVTVDHNRSTISVSDDGQGVPADAYERIFARFVRLEESRSSPGSGLGLALAFAIAKACRAKIVAEDARPGLRILVSFMAVAK